MALYSNCSTKDDGHGNFLHATTTPNNHDNPTTTTTANNLGAGQDQADVAEEEEEEEEGFHLRTLLKLSMSSAYLYPSAPSPSEELCIYDPDWHADASPHLPRVCVVGSPLSPSPSQAAVPWYWQQEEDGRLRVPPKTSQGKLSEAHEAYYYRPTDEEDTISNTSTDTGADADADEDSFGRTRRLGEDGKMTWIPARSAGRRWLWKNFC